MVLQINKEYLKEKQYAKTDYLEARIAIHNYTDNKESFHEWIYDKLNILHPSKILDIGCGTGVFWQKNYAKLPDGSNLVLTDFSKSMLEKAKKNVPFKGVHFEETDIDHLGYEDQSFDIVMAHHIIYHSSNKADALSGLKRVCSDQGFVSITTNSEKHMLNVYEIGMSLDASFPTDRIIDSFTEEIAESTLPEYFKNVSKHISEETLKVTDCDVVVDYVKSGVEPRNIKLNDGFYDNYRKIVSEEIENKGHFAIPKRSALYVCRK